MTLAGGVAIVAALGLLVIVRSRFVRGRLRFSALLLAASLALGWAAAGRVGDTELLAALGRLSFVLAIVNMAVALLVNSWRDDRPSDRVPAIVQDVAVIGLFVAIATVLMREHLLTTSAVGAVVVGFALQDTLGNLFAGLAIQVEKPFRVGQWVQVGADQGQVQEITWRATKLRTKAGQFLIIPNSVVAKEPVLNYSEPTVPTRVDVQVGASYLTPPNEVKTAIHEALANAPLALQEPAPFVELAAFGPSSVDYTVLFWVEDYAADRRARDQVRTNIWYTFRRRGIEIPWPIQVEYQGVEQPARTAAHLDRATAALGVVDLFAALDADARRRLAEAAGEHLFAAGEAMVHQGEAGDSMFVVLEGRARVAIEPSGQEVAVIPAGGFFGEMSMLTGDPRTATVTALEDARVLEIRAANFRELAAAHDTLIPHILEVVSARREGLAAARLSADAAPKQAAAQTLLMRIQRFLRL